MTKKMTQFISLLLDQWTTDKYATRLVDRILYYVIGEELLRLTCEDNKTVSKYPEEILFSSQEVQILELYSLPNYQNITA